MNWLLIIIGVHWVADFVLQTDRMARGKSKSNFWLGLHVAVYSACWLFWGWRFALFNGAAHFAIDYVSSRITSRLWARGRVHDFFVVIGADQALHMVTLVLSFQWLVAQ